MSQQVEISFVCESLNFLLLVKLSDIMNKPNNEGDNYSPRDEYINQRSYDNNARYGNSNRNDYNQRAEYPPVNRHHENEYYSDNYYEQH